MSRKGQYKTAKTAEERGECSHQLAQDLQLTPDKVGLVFIINIEDGEAQGRVMHVCA